jgi:hypothetical protein
VGVAHPSGVKGMVEKLAKTDLAENVRELAMSTAERLSE